MERDILSALANQVLVCEGAMGSQLAAQGVTVRNSAEANLTHPEIVRAVHEDYIRAGADVITANT
ncbi:MAG: homocysteine S-methyltransferase family protein, partial [Planctomycetota bacterium]|nr:homocysteine S-methyltransferase family protein [Planctomycetota bacterium]